ncbi:hypothetical protein 1 [Changjiang tombus-like virus 20]|uniref:hypothetical protein 1 n=1 Tax=Changjiang tombus-like virus 20 TaxID=1922814 RepID=UPI00090B82DF|nr:hypothetical protein 1 [Changjiang tombus-like virus 20]APG76264.1 hypothetical protein 1 [Changjiang tombus-like virus 20]
MPRASQVKTSRQPGNRASPVTQKNTNRDSCSSSASTTDTVSDLVTDARPGNALGEAPSNLSKLGKDGGTAGSAAEAPLVGELEHKRGPKSPKEKPGNGVRVKSKTLSPQDIKNKSNSTKETVLSGARRKAAPGVRLLTQNVMVSRNIKNTHAPIAGGQDAMHQGIGHEGRIKFTRPWVISPELQIILKTRFPNRLVTTEGRKLYNHPHPLSAIERAIIEEEIYETLKNNDCNLIKDIGGNASRHKTARRTDVHSCCPILSPKDVLRNNRYNATMNYCTSKAEDCNVVPDGYMAIHSLYYLEPATVLHLVHQSRKKILIASLHDFSQGYGMMHYNGIEHETRFQIVDRNTVLMTSSGNDGGPYTHSPCFWLRKCYYSDGKRAIAWGYRVVGDTYIYTFTTAPLGLDTVKERDMDLVSTIRNTSHHGEIGATNYAPLMNYLHLDTVVFRSYGPLVWAQKNSRQIFIPKGLIQRVAFNLVGKPRNRDTLIMCVRDTKQELNKRNLELPDSVRAELAVFVPPLAFLLHLEDEVQSFNRLVMPTNQKLYKQLNDAINLVKPYGCLFKCFGKLKHQESSVVVDEYNSTRTSLDTVKEKITTGFAFLSTTAKNAMKKQRSGTYFKVAIEEPREDKYVMKQVATTFSGHIPIVPTKTQSNTELALRNRVLAEVTPPLEGHWDNMADRFFNKQFLDFTQFDYETDEDKAFVKWNSGFQPGRQKDHERARINLKNEGIKNKHYYRKTFMKVEKLDKSSADGVEDFNPRAISGTSHESNVVMGPFMTQYSKQLAKQWNGEGTFYYTSGATGESTGKWMYDNFTDGDLIVEVDFSAYDSTQSRDSYLFEKRVLMAAGMDKHEAVCEVFKHQSNMRGFTGDGIEYKLPYGRNSGDPNTSCGNSLLTAATTEYVLTKVFGPGDYKIKVMGDDNTSIVKMANANGVEMDEVIELVKKEFLKFGFVAKVKIHYDVASAEFCSSAYWPATINNHHTYVMGPKPGRLLPKMGYVIKDLSPGEVKGMFEGYASTCSHIPVLKQYVNHCLKQMETIKTKNYTDKEAKYKLTNTGGAVDNDQTAAFFLQRYGLSLDMTIDSLKRTLDGSGPDDMVHWPLLEVIRHVDA